VLEVRPAIAWDKGKAVDYLLNSLGTYNEHTDVQYFNENYYCTLLNVMCSLDLIPN
jgi:hypothetical protein